MPTPNHDAPVHPFDEEASLLVLPMPLRLEYLLTDAQAADWFSNQALDTFLAYKHNPQVWGRICQAAKERFISPKQLDAAVIQREQAPPPLAEMPPPSLALAPPHATATESVAAALEPWRQHLQCSAKGEPKETLGNMGLIFHHHAEWQGTLWWDDLHGQAMCRTLPVNDDFVTDAAQWLCVHERMPVKSPRMVERTLRNESRRVHRDTLQEYILALPPWDGTERLHYWLSDCAALDNTAYCQAVSRMLPLSMVARALEPGCLYRYVVILEGPEEIGKSSLVRALAGEQGYVELSMGLESKEAHMMLRGVWVAELAELDSLSRTEETRLKSFITMREDSYIPKYTNDRLSIPRRTIFVGTTNEDSYLKGQSGNSRYLPIKLHAPIDVGLLKQAREQLLAEALAVYRQLGEHWWQLDSDALTEAAVIRDDRRIVNEYEDPLRDWLERRGEPRVTWEEIARDFLEIPTKERWKDRSLSMQISAAMRAIGWQRIRFVLSDGAKRTFRRGYEKKRV